MAELKILFLFLIIFNEKKELRCNALDVAPQDPEISTELPSDNELTHVRTKNLSGNVKLTTLELLTTNTPFDDLNNANEVIFEGTTSENKHFEIDPAVVENDGQEDALLSSEIGTKAPTDGFEPFALMDVFNGTSGTFPDQNSTEKLITVTPLNKLIDEDFDITRPNEADTETPNNIDKTTRATREFGENEGMQVATQNYADIEDLATFMKLDEDFLNTVTDKSEEFEYLNEAIEEISSILNSYEDKSPLNPSLEDDNNETKKQTYFETTTKELFREETDTNEENVDNENYETTTNLQAITTVEENLIEKSTASNIENESQSTINVEEENKMKKGRHVEMSSTKEYLNENVENLPVIFHSDNDKPKSNISIEEEENSQKKEDKTNLNEEHGENSQITTTTTTNIEEENTEMRIEINFETTISTYEDKTMSNLSDVEDENNKEYEDKMNNEATTTFKYLNEKHEENSQTTTTTVMNNEEENNEEYNEKMSSDITTITNEDLSEEYEINTLISYETTTVKQIFDQLSIVNDSEVEEEDNKAYTNLRTPSTQEATTEYAISGKFAEEQEDLNNTTKEEEESHSESFSGVNEEVRSTEETTTEYAISGRFAEELEDLNNTTEEEEESHSDSVSGVNEEVRVEEGETTTKDDSLLNSHEDKSLVKEKYKELNLGTPSIEETVTEFVISGRFAEERENSYNTTEEGKSHSGSFSDVTEEFKINEWKEETTENYDISSKDCEEDTTIFTMNLERTTLSLSTEDVQLGTTENSNIYDKVSNEQEEREDLNNTTEEKETHFDNNISDVTEAFKIMENNKDDTTENDNISSKDYEENSTISTNKIERTTTSTILNTEDLQVDTTEKSDNYEKVHNEQEVEDKLTINIDINELEKIEEAIVQEVNEIEEEDLKEMNNERTNFYNITESTTNYESKEIFTSTTILSFSKPDGYNQVITTAEMLKTESEKVEEPQISANISGRKQHFSVKIVYNESAFFVPSDARLTVQPPNLLNITWKAPNGKMNNSIELNFGNSLRLNLVKDNQMHVHKTALISEAKDKLSDTNLITLEEGIQIYFSNISFLKTDENGPGTLRRNNPMRTLAGEIVGSCIGACILIGIVVYFLAKKFRSKTRNFKPNGDA